MTNKLSSREARDVLSEALRGEAQGDAGDIATQEDVLPLDKAVVIGIVGPTSEPSALIRQASGEILKVMRGDECPLGTVRAVAETGVVISKGGRTEVLRLPRL